MIERNRDQNGILKIVLICAFIALIIEIFVFNYRFWFYGLSVEPFSPEYFLEDGTVLEYGKSYFIPGSLTLTSSEFDTDVKNIHIKIREINDADWTDKQRQCVIHVTCAVTDEGHAQYYSAPSMEISPLVSESMYIPVEAFGNVHSIQLTFSDEIDELVFDEIVINDHIPFEFKIVRALVVCFLLLIVLLFCLVGPYRYHEADPDKDSLRYLILIISMIFVANLVLIVHSKTVTNGAAYGYCNLASALADGRLYVAENEDEVLGSMSNPYDFQNRENLGVNSNWDTAYYNGKYYIYFGVVPAALLYLPYYLATGRQLTDMTAGGIILFLLILGGYVLVDVMRRRYYARIPVVIQTMLSAAFSLSTGAILILKRSAIYYIAIGSGLMLVTFALALWIDASKEDEISIPKGMLGSLLMALAVGCRPQFAIASFLGVVLFGILIRNIRTCYFKLILLILPYIPVAAALMFYNYARFGSPFDFGANYNMTAYDMVHMGIHVLRAPIGLWYYLFDLPQLHFEFPFMQSKSIETLYQGYMANELVIGGMITTVPIIWLCVSDFRGGRIREGIVLRRFCYAATPIVIVADVIMCGVLMRYQADMRIYLILPAVMIAMLELRESAADGVSYNRKSRIIASLCMATLIMCVLTVFAQYEWTDYSSPKINPVFYCKMRYFFS